MNAKRTGTEKHIPVLEKPVLDGLALKASGIYIDATFGRGGHSRSILERLGADGRLLAIDRDPEAIAEADDSLVADSRFELVRSDFAQLEHIALERNLDGRVDGLLLDLGVSSPQLDEAHRGFSFQHDGPLDMRMDPGSGQSAADWLANMDKNTMRRVLREYGEEREAGRIAAAIVKARDASPIETTRQLADVVSAVVPRRGHRRHPATRTFQAIRMAVNDELGQLDAALRSSATLLAPGGRLCVISFHSLEDRRVKRFMRDASRVPEPYRGMPDIPDEAKPEFKVVGRAVSATPDEIDANPRSRSARLRIAERL